MKFNVICAVAFKQIKDIFKNKTVLLQFVLFPIITMLMLIVIPEKEIKESIPIMMSTIFIGMIPLTCMSSIIAEEKEKNTLTALRFAFVSPIEYLIGIGSIILLACIAVLFVFSCLFYGDIMLKVKFLFVLILGLIPSMFLGSVLGLLSKNQMSIASMVSPVSMIVSLLPLFSTYNDKIRFVSQIIYTQQINDILNNINNEIDIKKIIVIIGNILFLIFLFVIVFRKKGLKAS